MRDNITKVAERGERLDQLQDKTGAFLFSSCHDGASAIVRGLFYLDENSSHSTTTLDNLAISAQGFRRGADRVRKVFPFDPRFFYFTRCLLVLPEHVVSVEFQMLIEVPSPRLLLCQVERYEGQFCAHFHSLIF